MNPMTTREPAVAGTFYPADANELSQTLQTLLTSAATPSQQTPQAARQPKALIVPHAGYIYSGPTAAKAYQLLAPFKESIHHVVLMGPSHRVYLRGMALPHNDFFNTPLGTIPINQEAKAKLLAIDSVVERDDAHALEHSLEVQLPFLQHVLGSFSLTPLVVGETPPATSAQVLEQFIDDPHTLLVISTDLSHFRSYQEAINQDQATNQAILSLSSHPLHGEQACGCNPLNGLLQVARQHSFRIQALDLCNSGDTAGDKSRVVGYGAWRLDNATHR